MIHLNSIKIDTSNKLFKSEYSNYIHDVPFLVKDNIILPYSRKADLEYMKATLETLLHNTYIIHVIGNKYLSRDFPNGSQWRPLKLYEIIFIDNCGNLYVFRTNEFYKYTGTHTLISRSGCSKDSYSLVEKGLGDTPLSITTIDILKSIGSNTYVVEYDPQYKTVYTINDIVYEDLFRADKNPLYQTLKGILLLEGALKKERDFFLFSEKLLKDEIARK